MSTHSTSRAARAASRVIIAATLLVGLLAALDAIHPTVVEAQAPATEEQAQSIERQLLCPTCTNLRLDVCGTAICQDMKRIIRERLAAGSTPDDIILYFETRYGEKVRARLEPEGFNLWLYGWIGASVLAVGSLGGWFLYRLRSHVVTTGGNTTGDSAHSADTSSDDEWLDAQIADGDDRSR